MPPPKRVLLMVSSMRGGGSERQVLLLAQSLDRNRFAPHLYLTEAAGDFLDQVPDDVPIHSFDQCSDHSGVYFPGRQLRRQTAFLRDVITDQSIDVVYDRTFHMTLIAGKAAAGVRRVSTIVSPPDLAVPLVEKRFVALKRRRLAEAYRRSDVVVAVSKLAASAAETYYGLPEDSVVVVKNPVDTTRLHPRTAETRENRSQETRLVCVGRMTQEKGHADLIDALAIALDRWPSARPRPELRLIGDGPLRSELQSQVQTRGLSEFVQFAGARKGAAAEIADADALILPSRFEGMPNVVLESMAIGTPVIATQAGGTIELQHQNATAFWAAPNDPSSLAEAILDFAEHPQQAIDHCRAARELIDKEHDLPKTIHAIENLLDGSPAN